MLGFIKNACTFFQDFQQFLKSYVRTEVGLGTVFSVNQLGERNTVDACVDDFLFNIPYNVQ